MPTRSQLTGQVPQADRGGVLVAEHQPSPPLLRAADEEVVRAEDRPTHRVGRRGVDVVDLCGVVEQGRRPVERRVADDPDGVVCALARRRPAGVIAERRERRARRRAKAEIGRILRAAVAPAGILEHRGQKERERE